MRKKIKAFGKHVWKHKGKYGAVVAVPVIYTRGFVTGVAFRSYNPKHQKELAHIRKEQSLIRKRQEQGINQKYKGGKL